MKRDIIILFMFHIVIAVCFQNVSILVCGTLYISVLFVVTKKLFGRDKLLCRRLRYIWLIQMVFMLVVYFVMKAAYGLPYDMNGLDDYMADVEWTDGCIDANLFSFQALKNSSKYMLFNNKAHLLLIVWLKVFCRFFGGYHTIDIRMFNLMVWCLSAILMGKYAFSYLKADKRTTNAIVTTIALFPNALFISSLVYRDVIVAFLIVLVFYTWAGFDEKKSHMKIRIIGLTIFITYIMYYLRVQAVLYVGMAVVLGFVNNQPDKNVITRFFTGKKCWFFILILFCICIVSTPVLANFQKYITRYDEIRLENGGIQAMIIGIPMFPFGWLVRILFYLMLPLYYRDIFPFHMMEDPISLIRSMISWGTIVSMFLYPYVVVYLKKGNSIAILYLFILVSTALATSGFRHVILIYPMLLTMGILDWKRVSLESRRNNMTVCVSIMGICALILAAVKVMV